MKTSNVSEFYWFLKNVRLENAKVGGRGSEISPSLSHTRSLALALSRSRASRFFKPVNFRHVCGFRVKTSRFYFKVKRRGSRSRVAPTEHHRLSKTRIMYQRKKNGYFRYGGGYSHRL